MSEAKSAITALGVVAERLLAGAEGLPKEPASTRLVRERGTEPGAPQEPPRDVLEEIRNRLAAASRRGELAAIQPKDRRYAPWLLWGGKSPAAEFAGVLPLVLDEARGSRPTLRRLIHAFLRDFGRGAAGIAEAAACIREQLGTSDPRLDRWRAAHSDVQLFDPVRDRFQLQRGCWPRRTRLARSPATG